MKRIVLAGLLASLFFVVPATVSAAQSITHCRGDVTTSCLPSPSTTTGVYFSVTTGGGNRNFASVAVNCTDVTGAGVYSTVLTVEVPPKGTGTSQTIYPPASSCTADLVKLMQIGKWRVLASDSFTVN
jgi:hypothetical protein